MYIQSDQIAAARLDETRRLAEHPERRALRELLASGTLPSRRTRSGRRLGSLPRPLWAAARDLS